MADNNQNIPIIIFCGGRGTRLMEETEFKPKPMVAIGGMPILWHIIKIYAHHGFKRFILCLGYKGQMIREYFSKPEFSSSVLEIIFADTGVDTFTGERLLMVANNISGTEFMTTYGDGIANIDIKRLLDFHRERGVIGTITGVHPTSKYGLVNVDEGNLITSFRQKPLLHDYINGGFMVFKKEFLRYLKPGQMIEDSFLELSRTRNLALYHHEDFWHCMDTYKDYEDLNKLWMTDPKWRIWKD